MSCFYLSVHTSRKSLLTEGLSFLVKIFRLFPPVDEIRAKESAEKLRAQATAVCSAIMEDLLDALPLRGQVPSTAEGSEGGRGGKEDEERGKESLETATEGDFRLVSEEEREADKEIRHRIYLALLNLACAMVRGEQENPTPLTDSRLC